ncbi:heterokaryon incompatibility protein-domain-containing protein [Fusarium venenatum]|uniref:heterokaryon incompatibility protein-domain-containing protein n=1 Tax=Fusarium venenatum TaxID=56646 RepID=UPI001D8C8328|nr:heterokaryon incompatibility protein-domain-containing protein [Fusarium venenatum]
MGISGIPLSVLPRTISDAVIVVRNLGYRYLWVDKLCIDQDCAIEKHAQVSLMDQIYGGAEITIVAAAGSDSEHGLPGVSSTLRRTTQKSELEECQIVFTPRHPHHFIRNSTWASRAWTYQEALLSRRLLFFTESETYFECHSMQSRECMRYDFETLHCKQGKLYAYFNSPLFLKGISTFDSYIRASVPSLIRSYECIVEYTNRNMTYKTDSLKAFIGIIKRLEKCKIPVFHLQGIPFLSEDCMDGTYKSLIAGLLWKHTKSPREASPPRRDSLPSWSWAGWEGKIRFFTNTREVYTHFIPKATLTGLELRNGTTLNLDAIPRNAMDIANLQASAIRLEAQFLAEESFFIRIAGYAPAARVVSKLKTPIRRPKSNLSQKPKQVQPSRKGRKPVPTISYDGFVSRLYVYEKPKSLNRFAEFFSANQFKALLIGHLPPFYPRGGDGTLCFLIVKPYKDGFSRVGILEVLHNFDAFIGDIQLRTGLFLIY